MKSAQILAQKIKMAKKQSLRFGGSQNNFNQIAQENLEFRMSVAGNSEDNFYKSSKQESKMNRE